MAGFGFGDAVIVEMLKDKGLLPQLQHEVDDIVVCMDPQLRVQATKLAASLRRKGRRTDLILEDKKLKWVFKHTDRVRAERLMLLGSQEWEKGVVRVKDLANRTEGDVAVADLV